MSKVPTPHRPRHTPTLPLIDTPPTDLHQPSGRRRIFAPSDISPPILHPSPPNNKKTIVLSRTSAARFCSVLQPSAIRGLATPWTYFLHLSLSSVVLSDSSTESPVHVLMSSIQAVRGLPRLHAPGIVPCIVSFSRQQLPCFHKV